jgi:very-short-patch-repair endonuclease
MERTPTRSMKSESNIPHHRIKPQMTARARSLRHDAPIPERILWGMLRNGQLDGLKFRRQHVIGPYVADFYCASLKLVIELDGMSHAGRADEDERRQRFIESQGLTVLRITNDDLLAQPRIVEDEIHKIVDQRRPSPSKGEGGPAGAG